MQLEPETFADACVAVLLRIALNQPEPARPEFLQVLRDDGWLNEAEIAALGIGRAA